MNRKLIFMAGVIILSASIIIPTAFAGRLIDNNKVSQHVFGEWNKLNLNLNASGISCAQGKQIVRSYGFDKIRSLNCGGRALTYLGQRDGESYSIVLSRNGNSMTVDEMGY